MLILTTLQADISGNVATVGYALGGLGVVVAAGLLYLIVRSFRSKKTKHVD